MKSGSNLCIAGGALIETGATAYYLAAQPSGSVLVATLLLHCIAAVFCALGGAVVTAPDAESRESGKPHSRAACFVFYVVPALLLPVGGVMTVGAMSYILCSKAAAPLQDASPFEAISPASGAPPSLLMAETISWAVRKLPVEDIRAVATGLRDARPARSASALLQHLQQHGDTEIRFRAQGAVARAIRPAEDLLKELSEQKQLTEQQKLAAADACLDLADWTSATGANRQTLLENAVSYLQDETSKAIPRLARLVRAQLAARRTDDAAASIAQLREARASEDLVGPMEAELLFQKRNWNALAERCASLSTTNPGSSGAVRFWRAAHVAAGGG